VISSTFASIPPYIYVRAKMRTPSVSAIALLTQLLLVNSVINRKIAKLGIMAILDKSRSFP
jgi:hypothetical protein